MSYIKFDSDIKKVVSLGRDIAIIHQDDFIGLEHLFLAILKHKEQNSINALNALNIDIAALIQEVIESISNASETSKTKAKSQLKAHELPLNIAAEKVLKATFLEVRKLNTKKVQIVHLILAILNYHVSSISGILKKHQLTYKKYLEACQHIIQINVDLNDIYKIGGNKIEHEKPLEDDVLKIMNAIKLKYEKRFNVTFSEDVLSLFTTLSEKYIPDNKFSFNAVDMLIKISDFVHNANTILPNHIKELQMHLEYYKDLKNEAVKNQAYEKAANLRDDEQRIKNTLEFAKKEWNRGKIIEKTPVQPEDVYQVFHEKIGLSIEDLKNLKDI